MTDKHDGDEPDDGDSLRGTMTAVLLMAAFFITCWVGVYVLHLYRR